MMRIYSVSAETIIAMHFHIEKMYKDEEVKKNVKDIFLSMCDLKILSILLSTKNITYRHKGNNKITELRTILQRESQNS
jgi:hypothetical protein